MSKFRALAILWPHISTRAANVAPWDCGEAVNGSGDEYMELVSPSIGIRIVCPCRVWPAVSWWSFAICAAVVAVSRVVFDLVFGDPHRTVAITTKGTK